MVEELMERTSKNELFFVSEREGKSVKAHRNHHMPEIKVVKRECYPLRVCAVQS